MNIKTCYVILFCFVFFDCMVPSSFNLYSPARFLRQSGVGFQLDSLWESSLIADCLPCALAGSPAIFLTKNCFKDKLYKPELSVQVNRGLKWTGRIREERKERIL